MSETRDCETPARYAAGKSILLLLAVLVAFGKPEAALAKPNSLPWFEMVKACEAIIADQSFGPLQSYEPAPFSSGMPGIKEYSVYSASRDLVAIARVVKGEWVRCLVRENEEDTSRWRELATEWVDGFEAGFPRSRYHWVKWRFNPNNMFTGAFRCHGKGFVPLIAPVLDRSLQFRVVVSNESSPTLLKKCGGASGS